MKIKNAFVFFFLSICMFSSCVKSFAPEIEKYEELLVVDGLITDAPGPYVIKLSTSAQLKQLVQYIPYGGCTLTITDDIGNQFPAVEHETGVYKTDSASFRGVVGRSYKLTIVTKNGDVVESSEEPLLKALEIENVYGEVEHKSDPELHFGKDGYQFYIDLKPLPSSNNFLMWNMQCTYKFRADYPIYSYYDNGVRHEVENKDTLRTCYRNKDILDLFILNTNDLKQTSVKRFPLNFEDNYTKALSIRYSLLVKQFNISESCYNYWSTIKKLRDVQGDLYTQQPFQAKNNIYNLTHPETPVLGYFTVGGYSEKRIFVNHPAIEDRFDICVIQGDPVKHLDDFLLKHPSLWPYFFPDPAYGDHMLDQECLDCRGKGKSVLEKPSFWVD